MQAKRIILTGAFEVMVWLSSVTEKILAVDLEKSYGGTFLEESAVVFGSPPDTSREICRLGACRYRGHGDLGTCQAAYFFAMTAPPTIFAQVPFGR